MYKRANYIFITLLTVLQIPLVVYCLYILHLWFQDTCPNKDFLSWDGDLRYITSLEMMDSLRNGRVFDFIIQIFDSPTWPVLRNLVQVVVFFIFGHSQELDVYITYFTFVLTIFLLSHIIYYVMGKNKLIYPLLLFLAWNLLLDTRPLLVYMFSAMLEIQGGLFFLLTSYYVFQFYNNFEQENDKLLLYKMSLAFIGLLFTKHPYGYMQVFCLGVLHLTLKFEESKILIIEYFSFLKNKSYKNIRMVLAILLVFVYIILGKTYLIGKSANYVKYVIALLVVFDFFTFLFKSKGDLIRKGIYKTWKLIVWVVLPIVVWIMIHPDRFSSSSGTISHIQTEGHQVGVVVEKGLNYYLLYFKTLIYDSFGNNILGILLFSSLILSFGIGLFWFFRYRIIKSHFVFSFISLVAILGLTFLTPNHQVRHFYHLYPTLIIIIPFLLEDIFEWNKIIAGLAILFITIVLSYFSFQNIHSKYSFNLCFTDTRTDIFDLPRWISETVKDSMNRNSILINRINPFHLNKADTELMMNIHAYDNKVKLLVDPKRSIENKNQYHSLYVVGNQCSKENGPSNLIKRLYEVQPLKTIQSKYGCIEVYDLVLK